MAAVLIPEHLDPKNSDVVPWGQIVFEKQSNNLTVRQPSFNATFRHVSCTYTTIKNDAVGRENTSRRMTQRVFENNSLYEFRVSAQPTPKRLR